MRIATLTLFLFLTVGLAFCADYYIDFDSGSDANNGTSDSTAWKHCPGDPNATGVADSTTPAAGDTFLFRGDVVYRGNLVIATSGTSVSLITYKGDGWGSPDAILEGADVWAPSWTQCTTSTECYGNENWANIWYTTAPAGFATFQSVYEDAAFLWFSQDPAPEYPIFFNTHEGQTPIPLDSETTSATRTTVTDQTYFTQSDSSYWDDSYVMLFHISSSLSFSPITSFNPATDTITFDDIGADLHTDVDGGYSILGHPGVMNSAGTVGYKDNTVFIWTHDSDAPSNHVYSVSQRPVGVNFSGCQYVVFEGFEIRGFYGDLGETGGVGVYTWNTSASDIIVRNNEIHNLRSMERVGSIRLHEGEAFEVTSNYVHHSQYNPGIMLTGDRNKVDNNTVEYVGYVGIWFQGCSDSQATGNLVQYCWGTHANGLSVYAQSSNVLVAHNRILMSSANIPFTMSDSEDIYTIGNIFDGGEAAWGIAVWSPCRGTNYVLHNSVMRSVDDIGFVGTLGSMFVVRNNIIDGGTADDRAYNLYCGLRWDQTPAPPEWYPETGEIVDEDTTSTFSDYAGGDFHLVAANQGIGAGTDVSAMFPTTEFPDYDFDVDVDGVCRQAGVWTMGALEFASAESTATISAASPVVIFF